MSKETCPPSVNREKASKISTTVPNNPIKGAVDATIPRKVSPLDACCKIRCFQICITSLLTPSPTIPWITMTEVGSCKSPEINIRSDLSSSLQVRMMEIKRNKKIHKVRKRYKASQHNTKRVIAELERKNSKIKSCIPLPSRKMI